MIKCRLKYVYDVMTFDELVEHGKASGANIVNGMPWSFELKGHPITHESDNLYIIGNQFTGNERFCRGDLLVISADNELYPISAQEFERLYEPHQQGGES